MEDIIYLFFTDDLFYLKVRWLATVSWEKKTGILAQKGALCQNEANQSR